MPAEVAEHLLHLGRQHLERLAGPVLPLGAHLVRPLKQPAAGTALDQHQVGLLPLEYSRIADVEVVHELSRQHPVLEVTGHPSKYDLEVAGQIEGRATFTIPAA